MRLAEQGEDGEEAEVGGTKSDFWKLFYEGHQRTST